MRELEKALAVDMLNQLSDLLGDACCNDFYFPSGWGSKDKIKFISKYHDWNGDPEEFDLNNLSLPNFAVASFLAERLRVTFES